VSPRNVLCASPRSRAEPSPEIPLTTPSIAAEAGLARRVRAGMRARANGAGSPVWRAPLRRDAQGTPKGQVIGRPFFGSPFFWRDKKGDSPNGRNPCPTTAPTGFALRASYFWRPKSNQKRVAKWLTPSGFPVVHSLHPAARPAGGLRPCKSAPADLSRRPGRLTDSPSLG
jgi:hypothetical protein